MTAPTTPGIRLVSIHDIDLEQVTALVNRAFATYSHIFNGQRSSPQDSREEDGEDGRVFLVEEDGRLLATGMVARAERFINVEQLGPAGTTRPGGSNELPPEHPWSGALYFGLAGVEPEIMNRGLGRLLVTNVESLARKEGFPRVALGTLREFGLVDYYDKLNYRVIYEETYPAGHWDLVVEHHYCEMVKDL